MKNLGEVKTIIRQQITRNPVLGNIKIDQSVFIRNLVIEEELLNCNAIIILMKGDLIIDMPDTDDYEATKLHEYQQLIGKLMYLICETKPNIIFEVDQLSKYNANLRKDYLKATKRVV